MITIVAVHVHCSWRLILVDSDRQTMAGRCFVQIFFYMINLLLLAEPNLLRAFVSRFVTTFDNLHVPGGDATGCVILSFRQHSHKKFLAPLSMIFYPNILALNKSV